MTETQSTKGASKKKFKMPTSVMILAGILVLLVVISWIIAWSGSAGEVIKDADGNITHGVAAMGIFGVGVAIGNGFTAGADLIFYLFILGAVIELMLVTKTLESGIAGLVKGLGGREILLIPILFVLFSAGGTIYGMSEETIALFVIVVPALSLAGFDTITGLMVILGGTATGCAVSTVNPFSLGSADAAAVEAGIDGVMSSILIFNLVWWAIMTAVTSSMMTTYAWYVRKNPSKSFVKDETMKAESQKWLSEVNGTGDKTPPATSRQKVALGMFMGAFVMMVLLFIPWGDLIGLDYSTGNNDPIFGLVSTLGNWYFAELSMMFIIVGMVIGYVLKFSVKDFSKTSYEGAKAMFSVAVVIAVARGIPYILETTGMQIFLVDGLIGAMGSGGTSTSAQWIFVFAMFFVFIILSSFITSTSGLANATIGTMTATVIGLFPGDKDTQVFVMGGIFISYMMSIGFWNFFVPTNPIVMASFQYSRVAYQDGAKLAVPMGLAVLVITLAAMIPTYMLIMAP